MNDADDELNQWLKTIAKTAEPNAAQQAPVNTGAGNAGPTIGAPAAARSKPAPGSPEEAANRARIQSTFGQVVLSLSMVPRYRHQNLSDLQGLVLEPLLRERIALAQAKPGDDAANAGATTTGIAFWASVSDEVDAKIREQIAAGVFPLRLKPQDWNSGGKIWLLDIIAPSPQVASAMMTNFQKFTKTSGDIQLHPVVARQVDPQLLKKNVAANPTENAANGGDANSKIATSKIATSMTATSMTTTPANSSPAADTAGGKPD